MKYIIEFLDESVQQTILSWPAGINANFTRIALRMEEHGANLGLPYMQAIGNGLFEIRAKGQEGIGRAFFCTLIGQRIIILHSFIKKTKKTPKRELDIANQRMKEIKYAKTT